MTTLTVRLRSYIKDIHPLKRISLGCLLLSFNGLSIAQTIEPIKSLHTYTAGSIGYIFSIGSDGAVRFARQASEKSPFLRRGMIRSPRQALTFAQLTSGMSSEGYHFLFGLTKEGAIYKSYQIDQDNWSNWEVYDWDLFYPVPIFKQIKCIRNNGLGLMVTALDQTGNIYARIQNFYYGKANESPPDPRDKIKWKQWQNLHVKEFDQITGTTAGAYSGTDGVLFARNKRFGSVAYTSQRSYDWQSWHSLEGTELKSMEVQKNKDGRITLLAIGGDGSLYERHETAPAGNWSDWTTLRGSNIIQISCQISISGRVAVFALHTDGSVDHLWQNDPGGENWSNWVTLYGTGLQSIATGKTIDGRMILSAVGGDGIAYYRIQTAPEMDWENWQPISF